MLAEINQRLQDYAGQQDIDLRVYQSNHEGSLIDTLHDAVEWADGVIFNPGAYTHISAPGCYFGRQLAGSGGAPE